MNSGEISAFSCLILLCQNSAAAVTFYGFSRNGKQIEMNQSFTDQIHVFNVWHWSEEITLLN